LALIGGERTEWPANRPFHQHQSGIGSDRNHRPSRRRSIRHRLRKTHS
jgi:hypothetical protein